jgi:hypothetical protein
MAGVVAATYTRMSASQAKGIKSGDRWSAPRHNAPLRQAGDTSFVNGTTLQVSGLNRATPSIDHGWVRGKNGKLLIHKPSPRLVVGRRNRRQEGESGGDRCPERAGQTITGGFELPELVQQNEVAPRCDIALYPRRGGNGASAIEVTHGGAGAEIVKDRKSCPRPEAPQIAGLTMPIGEPVIFGNDSSQTDIRPPLIGQCLKDDLNLSIRCTPDHGDDFCSVFHDSL